MTQTVTPEKQIDAIVAQMAFLVKRIEKIEAEIVGLNRLFAANPVPPPPPTEAK